MIAELRQGIPLEEFDYGLLMSALSYLKNPRQKITALIRQGHIVRVKKGLYVWGMAWRKRPVQLELLANLIYGPSIVSGDWALAYYGMIPERVPVVTSTGPKPPKVFHTPLCTFRYERVPIAYHSIGMERNEVSGTGYLIASAERALADRLMEIPGLYRPNRKDLEMQLLDELRIEDESLSKLRPEIMSELAHASQSPRLHQLHAYLCERRGYK